nr:transmembrane protein 230 isoform X6 [Microcebus murinus]
MATLTFREKLTAEASRLWESSFFPDVMRSNLLKVFFVTNSSLLLSGYISKGGADRAVPVLIIGILVFLPGFYHLRIAYYASKGYRGYSYDDIPDFDD